MVEVQATVPEEAEDYEELVHCPNTFCGELHPKGTLICGRCQYQLPVEEPDWSEDVPAELKDFDRVFEEGENPVIDLLAQQEDPSVSWTPEGKILASPEAQAQAANASNVRRANDERIAVRLHYIKQSEVPSGEQWFWSRSLGRWVDRDRHIQEDYNRSANRAKNWCKNNLRPDEIFSYDHLWVRLHHDEEYLAQMVVRDKLSPDPSLISPDVQRKARQVAERLGVLTAILEFHSMAYASAQDPEEGTCPSISGGNTGSAWIFMLIIFMIGALTAIVFIKFLEWLKPKVQKRTVATQSQTTYTSIRGVAEPRFLPLPEHSHGTFN